MAFAQHIAGIKRLHSIDACLMKSGTLAAKYDFVGHGIHGDNHDGLFFVEIK